MSETVLLTEIYDLCYEALCNAGSSQAHAAAVARCISNAERDGSASHGLFRLPGYVASLKSGKVNGTAEPDVKEVTPVVFSCDVGNGFAPYALEKSLPSLIASAKKYGIALLALKRSAHFAALWPEVEAIAEEGLVGLACTTYLPAVAPAGGDRAVFGTNPVAFAWPRKGNTPVVFDMATAAKAMGDVQIAARDGEALPQGIGLDANGNATTDPNEVLKGVILPFGGYKGSAISMMIELLAGPLLGQCASFRTAEKDNKDGGPPPRGEMIIALSPALISGGDFEDEANQLFDKLESMNGVRLPGSRRHTNRDKATSVKVEDALFKKVRELAGHSD